MSHHDHDAVGESVPTVNPPGGSQDPEHYSSAYFVLWGFTLLLAMVVGLQYFAWDWAAKVRDEVSGSTSSGAAAALRAEQEARVPQIQRSMDRVVAEHGSK
ncbi:MAG: hypothetical protein JKY65_34355 [Planctomycetes bacterium]|nr:hypothetical protein [Planctomycetota bacterium]